MVDTTMIEETRKWLRSLVIAALRILGWIGINFCFWLIMLILVPSFVIGFSEGLGHYQTDPGYVTGSDAGTTTIAFLPTFIAIGWKRQRKLRIFLWNLLPIVGWIIAM